MSKVPKRKRGPKSFKEKSKLPKYASQRTQLQHERDQLRESDTLRVIAWGFKLMWRECGALMRKYKIGAVGSFDKSNVHNGNCWGWPFECKITNQQVYTILMRIWKRKNVTYSMFRAIRKSLAYAFELTGGKPGDNFPAVADVVSVVHPTKFPESTTTTLPDCIPVPKDLKRMATTPWTPDSDWSFMDTATARVMALDCFVFGLRSREDVKRVKESVTHTVNWKDGWVCTAFKGGRSKLAGVKKGTRPWSIWSVCHCKGKKHKRPSEDFIYSMDKQGNPTEEPDFDTTCPVALLEIIFELQDYYDTPRRRYGKWITTGRFGKSNYGDPVDRAIDWLVSIGVCDAEHRYSSNSGRKSLGLWTAHLNIEYEVGFQLHGDLWEVWAKHYETTIPASRGDFDKRTQSTRPDVACEALRRLANWFGFGKKVKRRLSMHQRYMHHLLIQQGNKKLAERIRDGLPSDSSDDESSSD